MKFTAIVLLIVTGLFVAFGVSVIFALPVKWLWNSTLPELFKFPLIDVWMAWKLSFLSALLFKSYSVSSK